MVFKSYKIRKSLTKILFYICYLQVVSTSGNHLETDKKRRILRKMGPGYFKALNDSDFSDPDEILVVKVCLSKSTLKNT